jgi:hypothetical protein
VRGFLRSQAHFTDVDGSVNTLPEVVDLQRSFNRINKIIERCQRKLPEYQVQLTRDFLPHVLTFRLSG